MAPPASKRKLSSPTTPHDEEKQEELIGVAKASTKKTKRENTDEQRSRERAKEWADQRAERRKVAATEATSTLSSPAPSSTTAMAPTSNGKHNAKKVLTTTLMSPPMASLSAASKKVSATAGSTNTATNNSSTTVREVIGTPVTASSNHPDATTQSEFALASVSVSKTVATASHKSKQEDQREARERARQWADQRSEQRKGGSPAVVPVVQKPAAIIQSINEATAASTLNSATKNNLPVAPTLTSTTKNNLPSIARKPDVLSATAVAREAVRAPEEAKSPMPSSNSAAASLPVRILAEYAVSTTTSTIITFDHNRVTISAEQPLQDQQWESDEVNENEFAARPLPVSPPKAEVFENAELLAHNANSVGRSTRTEKIVKFTTKKVFAASQAFVAFLTFSFRILALAVMMGFCIYVWSFIYKDIATKMMHDRSLQLFLNTSSFGSPSVTSRKGYCYLNDKNTQSSLPSFNMSPSAAHGTECRPGEMLSKKRLPCPEHGVCYDGVWQSCTPAKLWEKHDEARSCRMTEDAQKTLVKVQQLLSQWTSNCLCGTPPSSIDNSTKKNVCVHSEKGQEDGLQFFNVRDVARELVALDEGGNSLEVTEDAIEQKMEQLLSLFPFSNKLPLVVYLPSQKVSSYMVALTKEASSLISLPYPCWMRIWLIFFLGIVISIIHWMVKQLIYLCVQYPISFAISTVTLFISHKIYATHTKRAYTRGLVSKARSISYDKLIYESQHGSNTYAILHLGEDVAQTLYPDSLKKRQDFIKLVWPRVAIELKNDVRIQQCQKAVGGVVLECCVWLGNKGSSMSTPATAKKESVTLSDSNMEHGQQHEGE